MNQISNHMAVHPIIVWIFQSGTVGRPTDRQTDTEVKSLLRCKLDKDFHHVCAIGIPDSMSV